MATANKSVKKPMIKGTAKKPVKKPKVDKWMELSANQLLAESEKRNWSLPQIAAELKKLGALSIETHTCCGASWIEWPNGAYSEHEDKHFGPFDNVAEKVDKPKVTALVAYLKKPGLDHDKQAKMMVDAGVHAVYAGFKKGDTEIFRFDDGKITTLAEFKFDLSDKKIQHKNMGKLIDTFMKAGKEEWESRKVYGAIAKLGLQAFTFNVATKRSTFFWSDGTRDYFDESGFLKGAFKIGSTFDKKALAATVKAFDNDELEYVDYVAALAKAGVAYYRTDLVAKKSTYWDKDGKQSHALAIKVG